MLHSVRLLANDISQRGAAQPRTPHAIPSIHPDDISYRRIGSSFRITYEQLVGGMVTDQIAAETITRTVDLLRCRCGTGTPSRLVSTSNTWKSTRHKNATYYTTQQSEEKLIKKVRNTKPHSYDEMIPTNQNTHKTKVSPDASYSDFPSLTPQSLPVSQPVEVYKITQSP